MQITHQLFFNSPVILRGKRSGPLTNYNQKAFNCPSLIHMLFITYQNVTAAGQGSLSFQLLGADGGLYDFGRASLSALHCDGALCPSSQLYGSLQS